MLQEHSQSQLSRVEIAQHVKRILIQEARINLQPEQLAEDEPLNGELLRITSLSFLGMIMTLEDELAITMADELFMKTQFGNVGDLISFIDRVYREPQT